MEVGDACWKASEFTGKGDEDAVIDGDEEDHEDEGDDRESGGRDLEGANVCIHGQALLDGEGLELSHAGTHDDGAAEDGDHREYDLCMLYVVG